LFEDNAEFGLGMAVAVRQRREKLAEQVTALIAVDCATAEIKAAGAKWLEVKDLGDESKPASAALVAAIEEAIKDNCDSDACKLAKAIIADKDMLVKKSQWILGGDGWAYDIGFGGLDHVLASGEDVNVLVFDTEVYSNTGGQSSKSTPTAAIAKFAAAGKRVRKKDLGMIAMSYGYVYVAQVAMGANQNQLIKALLEAERYPGPSLIIAYAPCINHGIRTGMGTTQLQSKLAVEAGYWHLWRYNPTLESDGKNPFTLDSKEPTGDFMAFIGSESRYTALKIQFPEVSEELFNRAKEDAVRRYNNYKSLASK
jgi:pyruvate-ferredoxin/flavodoxin oxidoreductase